MASSSSTIQASTRGDMVDAIYNYYYYYYYHHHHYYYYYYYHR